MTHCQPCRRRDGRAALVALVCVGLIVAALVAAGSARSAAATPSGPAPTAESAQASSPGAVEGLATTNSSRQRLLSVGLRTAATGLTVIGLLGARPGPACRPRRRRVVPHDVGHRWRALLIGAPPVSSSF